MAWLKRNSNSPQTQVEDVHTQRPHQENFPVMEEDGDLDIFLQVFERTCQQYHLPREQWARYLIPGLKGKALEVFAYLSPELDGDYDAIKEALIKRYTLPPEMYRQRFRSVKWDPTSSYADVVHSLGTTFRQWLRVLSITTFEDLADLMIKEQFLDVCPPEVCHFVCDREPKTADQAAKFADSYVANRMPREAKGETTLQRSPSWKERPGRSSPQPPVFKSGNMASGYCEDFWEAESLPGFHEMSLLSNDRPKNKKIYVMYHGTTLEAAMQIIENGFKRSRGGMLGKGVYVSRDINKAANYPLGDHWDQVILKLRVNVGRVKMIDYQGHPLQAAWHKEGYDTAWVPEYCGMVSSGLEEDCIWDPNRIKVVGIARAPPLSVHKFLKQLLERCTEDE
ncbi:uncharacterized protein RB166_011988 [Leptodactylus fuscus]